MCVMLLEKMLQSLTCHEVPFSVRLMFTELKKCVKKSINCHDNNDDSSSSDDDDVLVQHVYFTAAASLLFLRMVVPALLSPIQWVVSRCWYTPSEQHEQYNRSSS